MAITFQAGKIIAEFTSSGVSGDSAIGFYRLRFSLRYDTPPWPDRQFQFRNAKAEVYVVGSDINQKFLGLADPERPLIITAKPHASRSFILFNLHLSGKQLVAIEDVRRGGDLRFNLIIFGEAHADADSQAVQDELSIPVNQKAWIDVLKQMNYTDFILFEIPMPDKGAPADLKASVDLLSKAKEHYIFGNYVDTVATCRLALESLTKGLNEDDEQSEAVSLYKGKERTDMTKAQRELLMREAVRHYTHLAHHPSDDGKSFPFNRLDAALILNATAGIISHALQSRRVGS